VQVSRVDLDGRRIDFRLVREGEEFMARAMKDKGLVHEGRGTEGASAKRAAKKASTTQSRALPSPIQALKASVKAASKKAAAKNNKGRKSRRS